MRKYSYPLVCACVCLAQCLTQLDNRECRRSEVIRNETLRGQRHVVSKECRQQVRAQLFQQRENINFDPKLKSVCQHDIKQLCSDVPHGGGQVSSPFSVSLSLSR